MNVLPLAAESLGVRSSAFFVETPDVRILIDPGVSLAPLRFGLRPHPLEVRRMNACWAAIKEHARQAGVLIITHYHFDHFDHTEPLVFQDKVLLVKHPQETINASQRQRARDLMRSVRSLPRSIEPADSREFVFGSTVVRFSAAMPHGPTTKVGWVVQAAIRAEGRCFLYTSDIQGACLPEQAAFIRAENPDILYLDGPLTYMMGQGFSIEDLRASIRNTTDVLETTGVRTLILDHHLLRDSRWRESVQNIFTTAKRTGTRICTAAEFLGKEEELLEAHRRELFRKHPDAADEPLQRTSGFSLSKELRK